MVISIMKKSKAGKERENVSRRMLVSDRERKEDLLEILSVDSKEVRARAVQISGARTFQEERSASPKVSGGVYSQQVQGTAQRLMWLDSGEQRSEG